MHHIVHIRGQTIIIVRKNKPHNVVPMVRCFIYLIYQGVDEYIACIVEIVPAREVLIDLLHNYTIMSMLCLKKTRQSSEIMLKSLSQPI